MRPTLYSCKACRTDKRRLKPKIINAKEEYRLINMASKTLFCFKCKEHKSIDEFHDYQLKTRIPKCKSCYAKAGRKHYIYRTYKLTIKEYDELLKKQNYVCKICGRNERAKLKGKIKKLSVDHCHTSDKLGIKKIRGLLCGFCNRGLGMFDDSPEFLRKAAQYLEES